jgi:hypothetical protein
MIMIMNHAHSTSSREGSRSNIQSKGFQLSMVACGSLSIRPRVPKKAFIQLERVSRGPVREPAVIRAPPRLAGQYLFSLFRNFSTRVSFYLNSILHRFPFALVCQIVRRETQLNNTVPRSITLDTTTPLIDMETIGSSRAHKLSLSVLHGG